MPDQKTSKFVLACLVCVLLPLALYSGSLKAPFIFDDFDNIVNNADVQNPGQLVYKMGRVLQGDNLFFERLYWTRPITFLSFAATYQLSGLNPYGHRLFNVLVHAASTLLLFFLTIKIFRLLDPESGYALPLMLALVFAGHPMDTDAVTFISNRSDAIATGFYFAGLLFFIRMAEGMGRGKKMLAPGAASIAAFIAGLGTKEIAASFPLMVLLLDWIFFCNLDWKRLGPRALYHALCWLALLGVILFRAWFSRGVGYLFPFSFEWTKLNYLYTEFYVIVNYMRLLAVPIGQSMDHWIFPMNSFFSPKVFGSLLVLAAAGGGSIYIFRKDPLFKLLLFAVLWFFVTLSPTSSFLPINDAMVERRVYLPMWGFLVWALCLLLKILGQGLSIKPSRKIIALAAALILTFAVFTWRRNELYADPLNLWKEALAIYPENYRASYNAANISYGRDSNFEDAKKYYLMTLKLDQSRYEAHMNLGVMLAREKKFMEALPYLLKAKEMRPKDPECAFNLAVLYKDWGNYPKSLEYCEETLLLDPGHKPASRAAAWLNTAIQK